MDNLAILMNMQDSFIEICGIVVVVKIYLVNGMKLKSEYEKKM